MSMTKEEAAAIVENEMGDSMESRAKLLCASRTILNALEASERRVKELEGDLFQLNDWKHLWHDRTP